MIVQLDFNGSPYVGVFGRASESIAVLPASLGEPVREEIARALGVEVVPLSLGGSNILGSVLAMNPRGIVVADFADETELRPLVDRGLQVARLPGKYNAAGNNILANAHGALVNPDLGPKAIELVSRTLGVPTEKGTLAGLKTVGSAAAATDKGALCHPKTSEEEIDVLERVLKVEADIGTVNHGVPYIGAGILANTKGAVIGRATTGPEMNRIEDALRLY